MSPEKCRNKNPAIVMFRPGSGGTSLKFNPKAKADDHCDFRQGDRASLVAFDLLGSLNNSSFRSRRVVSIPTIAMKEQPV